jgi:hypothetical protein
MSQGLLITPSDLPLYGAASDFLAQFAVQTLVVKITTAGALGTMAWAWKQLGDIDYSDPITSTTTTPNVISLPDPGYAALTFAAGSYVLDSTYTIDPSGTVTRAGGAINTVTATRSDIVTSMCEVVTSQAVTWMQPRAKPPIISVGTGCKSWLADIVIYRLKSRVGMSPGTIGSGDENLRLRAEDAEKNLRAIGRSDNRPPDLVDSSTNNLGPGIPLMPRSLTRRGFGEFT